MRSLLLITVTCFSLSVSAQNIYYSQWQQVDSLIVLKNLPKTALEKVNIIYADAKQKNIHDEIIKALLYKLSIDNKINDNDINQHLFLIKDELKSTHDAVEKALLEILLANNLNDYYRQNFWRTNQRKETIDFKEGDITTWSNGELIQTIDSLISEALSHKKLLQETNIESINATVIKGNAPGARPTLYDLIAHEALDYYKTGLAYITQPSYAFKLSDVHVLSKADEFIQYNFLSQDTASHLLKAIKLFQKLMQFHLTDADGTAFIDINLERIQWVYNLVNFDNKGTLYKNALLDITNNFGNTKPAAEAWYLLAKLEDDKAASYNALSDTANRYNYVKAKQIIEERLRAMPDSCFGNDEMKSLLSDIIRPTLNTQAESVNVANVPFRIFVQYKNIDTLYARVLLQKDIDKISKNKNYDKWKDVASLHPLKIFQQALPQTNDYQQHSVEIKADALPPGDYTILFSSSRYFNDEKDKLAAQEFIVSGLACMHNGLDYFVVDRESGQPVPDVKISGTYQVNNEKSNLWSTKKILVLYTDEHGHFIIPAEKKKIPNYSNIELTLEKDNDKLEVNDNYYFYRNSYNNDDEDEDDSDYEDDNSHVYFFTDRSIYRPGQTVFYKGIVLTKDRKTKQNKLYHYKDSIEVDLEDANNKTIDSMFVRLNECGSFSGKFLLPQNVLTGEFTIETLDFDKGEINFNVEEYKRPTFYVEFDTLKNTYRLNETITLTGFAKAYNGSSIDNAKISYNIERSASFPYAYLLWDVRRPYSNNTQIEDSIINTDANGKFQMRFVAEPDSSIDKKTEPLFNFNIKLSATDANGETREAKTNVQVAYKSMVLQLNVPEIADAHNFKNIFITTKNSVGENIAAKVDITISPLQTPAKAYRKRLWQQPDQFVMSKEMYAAYFPYDEYKKEADYHEWKKLDAVVNDTFNTASTSNYKLKTENLKQGWYCIEATTKDKDCNEIKDVRYIQLYDLNVAGLPSPQINFSQVINNNGAPRDKAQLLLGTSEANVFAVEKITNGEKDEEDSFNYLNLDNNKKQIEYTIKPTDHDNIGLYYAFIKHNSYYTGGMQVYVNNDTKNLDITYTSFRNKTEPGSKETYTVQVHNNKGEKADAELLTSMYDASLDQFKKQQWEVPNLEERNYISNEWKGSDFTTESSDENYNVERYYNPEKEYDHIAKSADELWEVYRYERWRRIEVVKYTPSKVVYDSEVKQELQGRAMGVSVAEADYDKEFTPGTSFDLRTRGSLNDVVVTGYGIQKKKDVTGSITVMNGQSLTDTVFFHAKIRGMSSVSNINDILVIVDGVVTDKKIDAIDASEIDNVTVLKSNEAVAMYGAKAANGAIIITTKEYALRNGNKKEEPPQVQLRKNFNETAFFYPNLYADSAGNYTFSFTMPDALTQWKWMSFAHTKDLAFGIKEQSIITQKTLMVQPNLPRFLRAGDMIELTAKITNLNDSIINGKASLQLIDAITNLPLNDSFKINTAEQNFAAPPQQSTTIKFPVNVPANYIHPLTIKIIAQSNHFADGEENTLPVLSNRMLVTETLPLYMQGESSKEFKFVKLVNDTSSSLTNESLTVEYTPNPVWYAVQSLPYLMQFPHECAEQTFNRYYANALAVNIVAKYPAIKEAFEKWQKDSTALESDLEKNKELKQILLNETPWVTDAENETQQKKNMALLFDAAKLNNSERSALQQLKQMQMLDGAFAWFKGGYEDRYITQYILTGIGKLKKLNAISASEQNVLDDITTKALRYLDNETIKEYNELIKSKADLNQNHLSELQIQYLYMRSFFADLNNDIVNKDAFRFYIQQEQQYWMKQSPYMQGMIAISLNRLMPAMKPLSKFKKTQPDIIHSLKENAVADSVKGMYWKNNGTGYYWYDSKIEAQALLIDAFKEISNDDSSINEMSRWLILNKQTNSWGNTKATADACYALLSANPISQSQNLIVNIQVGDSTISTLNELQQSGSGYIKHRIDGKNVNLSMGNISVAVSNPVAKSNLYPPSYGAVYWQYFEDMDKITTASSSLSLSKKLFIEKNSDKGKILQPVNDNDALHVGDKVVMRLVLKTDRDMEYIQLKDMRAASMEPVNVLSEYKWQDGLGYYESTKDAATNFFIDHLAKGTYVFEYPVYITHTGNFSAGIATIQCMYAPEFSAHSEGINIHVSEK